MTGSQPAAGTGSPFGSLRAPAHWRIVDFISDLHLKADEPDTFGAWADYMRRTTADAIIILGDLFDAWVGDDAEQPGSFEAGCGRVLDESTAELVFMRGNRDFLVGSAFLARHGMHDLAQDPTLLVLGEQHLLLSHGDLLCTDDVAYQQFRTRVRDPAWQQQVLALPLAERRALAQQMRAQSSALQAELDPARYAEANAAVAHQWLQQADATTLIHGHTHKPADHALGTNDAGRKLMRRVLSDWHVADGKRRTEVMRWSAPGGLQRMAPEDASSRHPV